MLKFAGNNSETGRPVLGIGLSRDECTKLLAGCPIQFDSTGMTGLQPITVFIFGGEDEITMAFDLIKHGGSPQGVPLVSAPKGKVN